MSKAIPDSTRIARQCIAETNNAAPFVSPIVRKALARERALLQAVGVFRMEQSQNGGTHPCASVQTLLDAVRDISALLDA